MVDLNHIFKQFKKCDTTKSYIFVSYAHQDSEVVWPDVLRLQQDGYNIWMDEKDLDREKDSWRDDAKRAINNTQCEKLLFYVSSHSLCSDACLQEMRETISDRTDALHCGTLPFLAIDVEIIGDITEFRRKVHAQLRKDIGENSRDNETFERKALTLKDFIQTYFNSNNERVRIHSKNEPGRKRDYYEDIERELGDGLRIFHPAETASKPDQAAPVPSLEKQEGGKRTAAPTPPPAAMDLHTTKTLGTTDMRYSICTFGAAFHIGDGIPVTLSIDGTQYERKTHNTAKGRVDGLKKLYADHGLKLGDVLDVRYSAAENTIYLSKIGSAE